jgi:A118 family predicted phage portal protein
VWQNFIEWVKRLFGKKPEPMQEQEEHNRRYEDINGENITATISNKLATLAFADSSVEVGGTGKRVELVKSVIDALWEDTGWITAQMMGKGGKVLVPAVVRGEVQVDVIDQSRMLISEMRGKRITSATILADSATIDDHVYYRWADYTLDDTGVQTIRTRATTDAGREVLLGAIPQWADITDEITISGTDRVLIAFLRCPRDNRRDQKMYGVPITYGADRDVAELVEHLNTYRREFKLSRMMLGLDSTMWSNKTDFSQLVQPVGIETIKRTVQDEDNPFIPVKSTSLNDKSGWDVYAPPIRHEAMETRLQTLYRRLEKDCGLSQGILTERSVQNYTNRDEVRAAMFDTYSVISGMRKEWERALDDVAYAVDVLAERFGLTPAGARNSWEITVDWDTSMIESSAETWQHRSEMESRGMMSGAELRAWETGETLEEAQAAIDEIETAGDPLSKLLGKEPMQPPAQKPMMDGADPAGE